MTKPTEKVKKINFAARRRSRRLVLQALYQWQLTATPLDDIEKQLLTEKNVERIDTAYFMELLHFIPNNIATLDQYYVEYIDRPLAELNPVELAILRIGTYEIVHRPEIPYRVIINEGVELAKMFGATEGHKFINGVLDRVARQVRQIEINHE